MARSRGDRVPTRAYLQRHLPANSRDIHPQESIEALRKASGAYTNRHATVQSSHSEQQTLWTQDQVSKLQSVVVAANRLGWPYELQIPSLPPVPSGYSRLRYPTSMFDRLNPFHYSRLDKMISKDEQDALSVVSQLCSAVATTDEFPSSLGDLREVIKDRPGFAKLHAHLSATYRNARSRYGSRDCWS